MTLKLHLVSHFNKVLALLTGVMTSHRDASAGASDVASTGASSAHAHDLSSSVPGYSSPMFDQYAARP